METCRLGGFAEIAKRLRKLVQGTGKAIDAYKHKLTALDELKQSILQKAFTGKLTVKSPELEAVG